MGKDVGSVILFGLINTFMVVPVSISFCAIIFRDEVFDEYMPSLVKLVLFSSAIHQLCFSLFSSLPFAIGQVQDAGLIFLSAMAGSVASSCSKPENVVPSTLFILALSTSILGVMLIIVSKLKLASVVQYLPMPVIGGYLAFIGFFCGEAGLSMMAGVQVTSISQWDRFLNRDAIILLLPGLICGLGMSYCLHKFPSPLTFPVCLISILSVFYLSMLLSGSSFEDMRNAGWISPLDKAGSSFDAWKLYDISKVEWNLFPKQIITLLGMFLVVAFSSSLDVAAIEMELGLPLDYNRELNTVGISNLVSGLLGGYTGSYIFTQTTFNMRRGINNRWCGFMVVIGEIVIAMLPVSVVSFIPKMFFGSLLVLIASELLMEWLIAARTKMMQYEYAVCLLTFICIQMVGIELGMLIGVIAAMFCFVISYSNLQSVSAVTVKASTVIRTFEERSVLIANRGKVLTVSLSGYLFFGSAVKLLQEIKSKLVAADDDTDSISSQEQQEVPISQSHFSARKESIMSSTMDMIEMSPPPTLPKKLSRSALGSAAVQSSLDDVSAVNEHNVNGKDSISAFAGMPPLKSSSSTTTHQHEHDHNTTHTSSTATSVHAEHTLGHSYQHEAHSHGSHMAPSSHHQPMRMLFSSSHGPRQQKHIPTVYDMSADQIQSHYEQWSHAQSQQKPQMERKSTMSNGERRPSSSDLEMGRVTTPDKAKSTAELPPVTSHTQTPIINERTSLLTAAINNSYSKEEANPTPLVLSSSLTNKGLEDVKEIRESSVFLQVWESQQQRKEQQRKRRSYSDMSAIASSLSNTESDLIDRLSAQGKIVSNNPASTAGATTKPVSLSYNFHSQDNLEDMEDNRAEISPLLHPPVTNTQDKPSSSLPSSTKSPRKSLLSPQRTRQLPQSQSQSQGQDTSSITPLASKANNNFLIDLDNVPAQDMVTEYLILDFTTVIGVDATAARACFLTLVQFMRTANVTVVFAHLSPSVEELLRAHNVLHEDSIVIPNLDDALEWCEDQILIDNELKANTILGESMASRTRSVEEYSRAWAERQQHSLANRLSRKETPVSDLSLSRRNKQFSSNIDLLSLAEDFSSSGRTISARALRHILIDYLGLDLSNPSNRFRQLLESSVLTKFFTREQVKTGEIIFDIDTPATKVFFIETGTVELVSLNVESSSEVVRVNKASHGGVFGEADFILGKLRTVRAYSVSDCTFWILDREHFAAMEVQQPQLCMLIQYALLRSLALSYTCSMYALHPTTAYADDGNDV